MKIFHKVFQYSLHLLIVSYTNYKLYVYNVLLPPFRFHTLLESKGINGCYFRTLLFSSRKATKCFTYYIDPFIFYSRYTFGKCRQDTHHQSIDESMTKYNYRSTLKQYKTLECVYRNRTSMCEAAGH